MNLKHVYFVSAVVAAALLAQDTSRQQKPNLPRDAPSQQSPSTSPHTSISSSDRTFLTKAMADGKKEVEMATAAVNSITNAEVKAYAQKLVDDHTKANQELETLAQRKGVSFTAHTDSPHAAKTDHKKDKMSHAMSDRMFVAHAIQDHENAIALFEKESRNGSDPEVKEWATKTLPTLREHLATAKSLQGSTGQAGEKTQPRDITDPHRKLK